MSLNFYKPNKSVKGALASFSFNSKDGALYIQLVRQTSYDEKRHIGGFKDGAKLNTKFNAMEIGGLLRSLKELKEAKFIHTTPESKTNITFGPYNKKDSDELAGFGMRIYKGEESFSVPFSLDEAYLLEEYLKYVLTHFFNAIYYEDKKRAAEYAEKKASVSPITKQEEKKEAPKAVESDDDDDSELF